MIFTRGGGELKMNPQKFFKKSLSKEARFFIRKIANACSCKTVSAAYLEPSCYFQKIIGKQNVLWNSPLETQLIRMKETVPGNHWI